MAKLAVFNAAVAANLWGLGVLGVLASVVAAYYYLRLVKVMFFDEPAGRVAAAEGGDAVVAMNRAVMVAAALFCSPAGYFLLGALATQTQRAAASLF
jgi:NADH-quinone oxidoreductase subunit N